MKLEVGEYYRTRSGTRAKIQFYDGESIYPFKGQYYDISSGLWVDSSWRENGSFYIDSLGVKFELHWDIVEKLPICVNTNVDVDVETKVKSVYGDTRSIKITEDSEERKNTPIATGVLDYFPLTMAALARLSKTGNDKHNPGQPLYWSKDKSNDHADCIARHLIDRGKVGDDGTPHSVSLAWRAFALCETELESK